MLTSFVYTFFRRSSRHKPAIWDKPEDITAQACRRSVSLVFVLSIYHTACARGDKPEDITARACHLEASLTENPPPRACRILHPPHLWRFPRNPTTHCTITLARRNARQRSAAPLWGAQRAGRSAQVPAKFCQVLYFQALEF